MRLTKRERFLLARAADFVIAGEWPWESDADPDAESAILERAAIKLKSSVPGGEESKTLK